MSAPQALRSNYPALVGSAMLPVLEETFVSEYNQKPSKRDVLFKDEPTSTSIWQYTEVLDMPLFGAISEGADYTMSATSPGSNKTVTVSKYGLAANFSEELVEDSKFSHIADTLRKMAKSARESKEVAGMNILNNAFGSTLTADGAALCGSHTVGGSVTVSNVLATPADLSISSLKAAVRDFRKNFKGSSGIIYDIKPKYLIVPEDLRLDAIEIVKSELLSGTADNNINSIAGEGLEILASPHLTDTDAWFLASDKSEHGLRVITRKALETKAAGSDVGFLNDSIYFKARYREALAAVHFYGFYGTPGA